MEVRRENVRLGGRGAKMERWSEKATSYGPACLVSICQLFCICDRLLEQIVIIREVEPVSTDSAVLQ